MNPLNLRHLLPTLLLFGFYCVGLAAERPNVLLIITDDQGYGDVSAHGNTMLQTPNLDALAKQSLRLTNFHVEPTCAETRAALMSGKFPLKVGVWHTIMGRSIMQPDVTTLPDRFRAAGYRTGMFGKWHLGDNYPYRPQDRGFDVTLHHGGGGVGQTPDVWGNDYFNDVYFSGDQLTPARGYCTDVFFDAAEQFICAPADQPFFCYLATNAPHGPYLVDDSYKQPYLNQGVAEPMASFYGMIANIDENLGTLMAKLEERSLARETIVIFMTDNGTAAGFKAGGDRPWNGFNAGMRGTKGNQYEGGHRVPCFIRMPDGKLADQEFAGLTAHVDLTPTLAELCQFELLDANALDGRNVLDMLSETAQADVDNPRTLVVQSHRVEKPRKWIKSAVLSADWRLIDGQALYNLASDPAQTNDLASTQPDVVTRLRDIYESWWRECAPDSDRYSRPALGHEAAPRTLLTAHDWHGPSPPWNQRAIANQPMTNGYWEVSIERDGWYQFLLARQPLEEPRALDCSAVELQIGDRSWIAGVNPRAVLAPFTVQLSAGEYRLSSTLRDVAPQSVQGGKADRGSLGAFYVYASYLGKQQPTTAKLPEWLSRGDRVAWVGETLLERGHEDGSLEAELSARFPEAGLTFINVSPTSLVAQEHTNHLDLAAPSVVVIAYGMSEALNFETPGDEPRSSETPSSEFSVRGFQEDLTAFVQEQQRSRRGVVLCRLPDIELDAAAANEDTPWKSILTRYTKNREDLNRAIEQVALATGHTAPTPVIDLPALSTGWFEPRGELSQTGYRSWAAEWSRSLAETPGGTAETQATVEVISPEKEQALRDLSLAAHRIFLQMHRSSNETDMNSPRRHEPGNMELEPSQYRPLLAETQWQMLHQAARADR